MVVQSSDFTSVPSAVQNLVASKIALGDLYVLFCTGNNEYTALVYNPFSKVCVQHVVSRQENYGMWTLSTFEDVEWSYQISNEYYAFSNVGSGTELHLPVYDRASSFCSMFLCVSLMFCILFKWVLFPSLRGLRRR